MKTALGVLNLLQKGETCSFSISSNRRTRSSFQKKTSFLSWCNSCSTIPVLLSSSFSFTYLSSPILYSSCTFYAHCRDYMDFQNKYAITGFSVLSFFLSSYVCFTLLPVIARIFYHVNTSRSGYISFREFRKSNLCSMMMLVDEEEDINKVSFRFSFFFFHFSFCIDSR